MDILSAFIVIFGLVIFEIVNSVDNAIVNAYVLRTMNERWRKIFLFWGLFIAVFIVRGVLPFLVVWLTVPGLGFIEAFQAVFSSSPQVAEAIEAGKPLILMGSGVFLFLLYLHWLFLEEKEPLFVVDKFIKPHYGIWFFACAAMLLVGLLYFSRENPMLMLSAAIGNAAFFILYGFREQAEKQSKILKEKAADMSNMSKFFYLEVLDASFSFDGVLGAFAFTTSVPLILIGNGIGALIVRELTIRGVDKVAAYRYLKNGAMTSIGFLGFIIVEESFGLEFPEFLPTLITLMFIGIALLASHRFNIKRAK
ncbi:MAG TPA: DUF475 domain-containing protein [Candidatus Paceibacterota bacterium]|nr:DUF475 domain-containing protein [Candidatus Pacearchaeota archaeon]HRZ50921.1 DUF475 domain-containing protein [Candidatus Paceibacterota bacterium]HSA36642.1 DUF475 domain-containing protein [Candidatus Paceibacterota bacterium]